MLESRIEDYKPVQKIPVETITDNMSDEDGILGYIHSLTPEEFNSQFLQISKRALGTLESKSCDRVGDKNKWQGELIEKLAMDDDSQHMADLASNYGHKFSMIYCSLNCPHPCTTGRENIRHMYQMYQFLAPKILNYSK